jgi:aldehyde dehydrogenase (NAD+)
MSIDTAEHEKRAADVLPKLRLLVDGAWQDRSSGGSTPQVNPSTGQVQCEIPMAGDREIDDAAAAAQAATGAWRDTTPLDRRILLTELARLVEENKEQLATILTLEPGLPSGVTQRFVQGGADFLAYNGSVAETTEGDVIHVDPARGLNYVLPEPYGVVPLIMTWNGGLSALGRKAGAALAAGNTVVIKPSEPRLLVHSSIHDEVLERVVALAEAMAIDDPSIGLS